MLLPCHHCFTHLTIHNRQRQQGTTSRHFYRVAHRSFPTQPVLALAASMYAGKSLNPSSTPTRSDARASSRRWHPRRPHNTRLCWGTSSQYALPPRFPFEMCNPPSTVVQDFSTLPGCYAASVPALIAGYWSAFFSPDFTPISPNPFAGLRPSSSRVSCRPLCLFFSPSVLTTTTRRVFCSRNVEGVRLVERSVCRSSHVDPDGAFQKVILHNILF